MHYKSSLFAVHTGVQPRGLVQGFFFSCKSAGWEEERSFGVGSVLLRLLRRGGTGFEKLDYLQCCKFAEGDSRILMQKLTRDRLQAWK